MRIRGSFEKTFIITLIIASAFCLSAGLIWLIAGKEWIKFGIAGLLFTYILVIHLAWKSVFERKRHYLFGFRVKRKWRRLLDFLVGR